MPILIRHLNPANTSTTKPQMSLLGHPFFLFLMKFPERVKKKIVVTEKQHKSMIIRQFFSIT